ncbi:DUF2314 domain-containing protein [Massilia sp. CF038]|uniref:DUF2314 domain-containing protein n=1 Tax=Massilia sp. CF038 TaxID=1881045 RepID=UPI0009111F4C|nr:DUF2314 domain-containing protein [Massilia sp. CF038]SHH20171.1 hypothetical protein SAMN05428948_3287 [Massilia sp. CF038]
MSDEALVPLFIPALCVLLISAEDAKGSPLTEAEVLKVRDGAGVMMVAQDRIETMAESRGYNDLDPENCWYDWQMLRRELDRKPDLDPGIRVAYVSREDDDYQATIVAARGSLGSFRQMLADTSTTKYPSVKVLLEEPDHRAYIWLSVVAHDNDGFVGEIFELPREFKTYSLAARVNVRNDEIQDWMINDEGRLHGGFSLRYARARMSDIEKAAFDEHVGVHTYM